MKKQDRRHRIKLKIRKRIIGTAQHPRLNVYRSNSEIYAQLIDDKGGKTLVAAGSSEKGIHDVKAPKAEKAKMVGKAIAEKALAQGIKEVIFDRNGFLYHGRIKSLAEGAREAGLIF